MSAECYEPFVPEEELPQQPATPVSDTARRVDIRAQARHWLTIVDTHDFGGLQARKINAHNEPHFARLAHRLVAEAVLLEPDRTKSHRIIDRTRFEANLRQYYDYFPPFNQTRYYTKYQRFLYQDERLFAANQVAGEYPEIPVFGLLLRSYREAELMYPSRAMYAVLTAIGDTVLQHNRPPDEAYG